MGLKVALVLLLVAVLFQEGNTEKIGYCESSPTLSLVDLFKQCGCDNKPNDDSSTGNCNCAVGVLNNANINVSPTIAVQCFTIPVEVCKAAECDSRACVVPVTAVGGTVPDLTIPIDILSGHNVNKAYCCDENSCKKATDICSKNYKGAACCPVDPKTDTSQCKSAN